MPEIKHSFHVMTYDIDFAGIVSNISCIRWLEDLRNLFAEQVLPLGEAFRRGIAPIVMRTEIDYVSPVHFPDVVEGRMWVAERGRAKWVLAAEFTSRATGQVSARAKQKGTFIALDTRKVIRLPEEFYSA